MRSLSQLYTKDTSLTPTSFPKNKGLTGDDFRFDVNGDGPARYNIIHFKQVQPGKYDWVKVGEYNEGSLNLDIDGKK